MIIIRVTRHIGLYICALTVKQDAVAVLGEVRGDVLPYYGRHGEAVNENNLG